MDIFTCLVFGTENVSTITEEVRLYFPDPGAIDAYNVVLSFRNLQLGILCELIQVILRDEREHIRIRGLKLHFLEILGHVIQDGSH